ncbi:MAG: hypothetical protein LBL07_04215 [Tannerella sp.]|nr:hypothetical protein [Tannerella sp.]
MQTSAVSGADVRVPPLRTSALRNADVRTGTTGTSAPETGNVRIQRRERFRTEM